MDNLLFLEKLSQVCEWERRSYDNHKKTHCDTNVYPAVVDDPKQQCEGEHSRCIFHIRPKEVDEQRFWMTKCWTCKLARTQSGEWLEPPSRNFVQMTRFLRDHIKPAK